MTFLYGPKKLWPIVGSQVNKVFTATHFALHCSYLYHSVLRSIILLCCGLSFLSLDYNSVQWINILCYGLIFCVSFLDYFISAKLKSTLLLFRKILD